MTKKKYRMTAGTFSKFLVMLCISHLLLFTYLCLALVAIFRIEIPSDLIISNFAFFGTELAALLVVKICKLRNERSCQNVGGQ